MRLTGNKHYLRLVEYARQSRYLANKYILLQIKSQAELDVDYYAQ